MDKEPLVRRSAGMRGSPPNAAPEHSPRPSTPPILPPDAAKPERTPPYAKPPGAHSAPKPKVLMGEVAMPRGQQIGKQREAFRAFMLARHLRPTEWARKAGIPSGEILAFLAGTSRSITPASLEKLAQAADCAPEDMLR